MWKYSMYITAKDGHRIYRKNHKPFRFWVDDEADHVDFEEQEA